ncbi:MAG: Flp family type IVb pilin [Pirellulaceae bacterium]
MISFLKAFHREEDGPTAVEYAVMMAMILGACIATVKELSDKTGSSFKSSEQAISSVL